MKTLLREANATSYGAPVYLALAEYSKLLLSWIEYYANRPTSNIPVCKIPDPDPTMHCHHTIPSYPIRHRLLQPRASRRLVWWIYLSLNNLSTSPSLALSPTTPVHEGHQCAFGRDSSHVAMDKLCHYFRII
jgi:hypothetical protein